MRNINRTYLLGTVLTLLLIVAGCGDNTVLPEPVPISITLGFVEPVAGYENISRIMDDGLLDNLDYNNRECGDPGDGWQEVHNQPNPDCGLFYFWIDDDKGYICGPPECATYSQMVDMYEWLARYMTHLGTTMHEVD